MGSALRKIVQSITTAGQNLITAASVAAQMSFLGAIGYADSRYKIGYFTRDLGEVAGDQAITGVGFQPKAIIFLMNRPFTAEASVGIYGPGPNNWCIANGHNYSNYTWTMNGGSAIWAVQPSSYFLFGAVSAVGSDGFTVTWTKQGYPSGEMTIAYLALR